MLPHPTRWCSSRREHLVDERHQISRSGVVAEDGTGIRKELSIYGLLVVEASGDGIFL